MTSLTTTPARPAVNPAVAYLAGLPSEVGRRKGIESRLRSVAKMMGFVYYDKNNKPHGDYMAVNWSTLDAANMRAILAKLQDAGQSPNTIALSRAALRGIARAMYEQQTIDQHTYDTIMLVKTPSGSRLPAGRDLTEHDKAALMDAAGTLPSPRRERERALLAVLMASGARIHEVANADVDDVNLKTGKWRIIGKGNKERMPPLNTQAIRILRQWLDVRTHQPGPLFCAINKTGKVRLDGQLSTVALHKIIKQVGKLAGVELSAHDFRRTVAGDLLGVTDVSTAKRITGHSKTDTLMQYDRRHEQVERDAVEQIVIPE
jgi:site-specific recombinase XerD